MNENEAEYTQQVRDPIVPPAPLLKEYTSLPSSYHFISTFFCYKLMFSLIFLSLFLIIEDFLCSMTGAIHHTTFIFISIILPVTVGSTEFPGTKESSGCLIPPHFEVPCTPHCASYWGRFKR